MKFSEMPYARPDTETVKKQLTELTERLKNAGTYEEAKAAFLEEQKASLAVETQATLASATPSTPATPSTTERRSSGTPSARSWRSMSRRGRLPCWIPRSARTFPRSTAT